jgi:branched-chain amino acid transport system ATP-binding protein
MGASPRLGSSSMRSVEQNLGQALEVADRGYVIETGTVKMEGSSAELLRDESVRSAYLGV